MCEHTAGMLACTWHALDADVQKQPARRTAAHFARTVTHPARRAEIQMRCVPEARHAFWHGNVCRCGRCSPVVQQTPKLPANLHDLGLLQHSGPALVLHIPAVQANSRSGDADVLLAGMHATTSEADMQHRTLCMPTRRLAHSLVGQHTSLLASQKPARQERATLHRLHPTCQSQIQVHATPAGARQADLCCTLLQLRRAGPAPRRKSKVCC